MDSEPLTVDQLNVLAEIEPRDVLLAKIDWWLQCTIGEGCCWCKAVINKAGYALSALVDKKQAEKKFLKLLIQLKKK